MRVADPDDATQPATGVMIADAISQAAYESEPTDSPLPYAVYGFNVLWVVAHA